jgi:hypothetical protein
MARGLDQFLANRLTNGGVFRIVAEPGLADAVLTDRLGEGLRSVLDEIAPLPKASEEQPKDKKNPDENDASSEPVNRVENPALNSTFGRGKGTIFLVDMKSRQVLWSTFQAPTSSGSRQLDRTASDIVNRLKRDLPKK